MECNNMVEGEEQLRQNMSALAILSCRPNSHPFQERHIPLHETIKIGRSVARARQSPSNGIFDCKVLSRHHAMLWYDAGKFYLQDTKSSNGTFINNQRLCKGGEESPAREVYSGDLIQFGVEVMENNRRGEKITHGCIIATMTLYHPDGREAKPVPYLSGENQPGLSLQTQDLYQLAQYLQEALHREKMLSQKLVSLQQLVATTQQASESGWQALIDEDKLLARLEMLDNQLHLYSKNHSEDTLRTELVALHEDKNKYETTSKESLRRVLQEKLEAVTKLSDLETSLGNMTSECGHLKQLCEVTQGELATLALKYQDQLQEVQTLTDKLQEAEAAHSVEVEKCGQEKAEVSLRLEEMVQHEAELQAKIESLTADNDFTKEQLSQMKAKLESIKEPNEDDQKTDIVLNSSGTEEETMDIMSLTPLKEDADDVPENLEAKLKDLQKLIEVYKGKLESSDTKLQESNDKIKELQGELDVAVSNCKEYLIKISTLEDKAKLSDYHMSEMMENALQDLKLQLKETARQSDSSNDLIETMKDHIQLMEKELTLQTPVNSVENSTESLGSSQELLHPINSPDNSLHAPTSNSTNVLTPSSPPDLLSDTGGLGLVNGQVEGAGDEDRLGPEVVDLDNTVSAASNFPDLDEDEALKALLEEARQGQKKAEVELRKYKDEASESLTQLRQTSEEMGSLRLQLEAAHSCVAVREGTITQLQDQVTRADAFTEDVKQQILDLREQLESERTKIKVTEQELEDAKMAVATSQQNAKQNHNETEHLKEYQALKEECANLRKRIQAIEAEMKMSRKENLHLSSEYNKLQESYKHLESLKVKLETGDLDPKSTPTVSSHREAPSSSSGQELECARAELVSLRVACEDKAEEIGSLQMQISDMSRDYQTLQSKSRMVSLVSSIPLLMLLFAVLLAVYPVLEAVTAAWS